MDEEQFWKKLHQLISQSDYPIEVALAMSERLVELSRHPTLAAELIIQTICKGSVYLPQRVSLNLPTSGAIVSLSAKQQLALEMALSQSALALISGSPATGKTRIAAAAASAALNHQKHILILTHYSATLDAYRNLPGYPFLFSENPSRREWLIEQLRAQHLAQPQINSLPLHLLPDRELDKIRGSALLETWLPIIQSVSISELIQRLQPQFPHLGEMRLQLLAERLKELEPLLQEQLQLSQLYQNLPSQRLAELAENILNSPLVSIIGTVAEFLQPQHQNLWQTAFDLVILEDAQHLTLPEIMLLSGLGQKLVLFGDAAYSTDWGADWGNFPWLAEKLLPAYRCNLSQQFRLHPEIATPVYQVISSSWISTRTQQVSNYLPQLTSRILWHDVSEKTQANQIFQFIRRLGLQASQRLGIITFTETQRDLLLRSRPDEFSDILIGTVAEWAGKQRDIVIVSCIGELKDFNLVLTRACDYLILFGNYQHWVQTSPMQALLTQPELQRERLVVIGKIGDADISPLSEPAPALPQLVVNQTNPAPLEFVVRQYHRARLEKLISEAQQFLLISSYIIEDKSIAQLICNKAAELPQGVWLLTNLSNEIIERLDTQFSGSPALSENHYFSDERKKDCLRLLLDALLPIRIGNIHLNTIISEQAAYLGSFNLTGGSLDYNLEAAVAFSRDTTHKQLIDVFRYFWNQCSTDELFSTNHINSFYLRSVNRSFTESYPDYSSNFLTPSQYRADLLHQLAQTRGQVQIYTGKFKPDIEIQELLCRQPLVPQIFAGSSREIYPPLDIRQVKLLHANVTIIGDKVAYIGGINFDFSRRTLSSSDLMYKIVNSNQIDRLSQHITQIYSKTT